MPLAQRPRQTDPRRGTARALRRVLAVVALAAIAGCSSTGGGLLSIWRQGGLLVRASVLKLKRLAFRSCSPALALSLTLEA